MSGNERPQWKRMSSGSGSSAANSGNRPQPPARRSVRNGTAAGSQGAPTRSTKSPSNQKKSSKKGAPKKPKWGKRIGLGLLFTFLIVVIVGAVAFLIAYSRFQVPEPDEVALAQTSTVYYADGTTEMGSFSDIDRTIIDTSEVPDYVPHAIVSSEDRTFYTNSGVDLKGIARSIINNLRGGPRQGASTLTQQYVDNYYVGQKSSGYMDKLRQAILALKINRSQSKEGILDKYMNTIYFGRGAYGIEAAAEAYFGEPAKDLTLSQAALLAGIIPAPSDWDPAISPDRAKQRWARVLTLMVEDGWITQDQADQAEYPETIDPATASKSMNGSTGYFMQQVRNELMTQAGFSSQEVETGGFKVVTTITQKYQKAVENAVKVMPEDTPESVRMALSAVDNKTGEILAEYPGSDYSKVQTNAVTQDIAAAGSTFKPFTLLAYVQGGGSIWDTFNGNSPQTFDGYEVQNNADVSFGFVTLVTALRYSINTAFVALNQEVTPQTTLDYLVKAGIPKDTYGLENNIGNVLGSAAPHNIDLARAYATLANGGQRITPHMIREVRNEEGEQIYVASTKSESVFEDKVVAETMPALQAVTEEGGTGEKVTTLGRDMGGKTGTSEEQKSAQFVAFIPQMTVAVSMYGVDEQGNAISLPNIGGLDEFHGSDWPVDVWLAFMEQVTPDLENIGFEWLEKLNEDNTPQQYYVPSVPDPEPDPEPEPAAPAPTPTPEPDPTPAPDTSGGGDDQNTTGTPGTDQPLPPGGGGTDTGTGGQPGDGGQDGGGQGNQPSDSAPAQ